MKTLLTFILLISINQVVSAQVCVVTITHVISGNQVQYYGASPDNPTQWSWFFNGGTPMTSSLQDPVVTYSALGTFNSALSVSGGPNNCSSSLSNQLDSVTITSLDIPEIRKINDVQIFNRSSIPTFEISSNLKQNVIVELFDINGNRISVVFKGYLNGGSNILRMKPVDLPSGNYILNIITDNGRITKKFNWVY